MAICSLSTDSGLARLALFTLSFSCRFQGEEAAVMGNKEPWVSLSTQAGMRAKLGHEAQATWIRILEPGCSRTSAGRKKKRDHRAQKEVWPKLPSSGMLGKEGGTRQDLPRKHERERRPVPQPLTSALHTHTKNKLYGPMKISGADPSSLLPYRELKVGLGQEAEQQGGNMKLLTPCPPPQDARERTSKGTWAGWGRATGEEGEEERKDFSRPHVAWSPDGC